MSEKIGYDRGGSSDPEILSRELKGAGCLKVYSDSGPAYQEFEQMLDYIRPGDVVLTKRLTRLGRSITAVFSAIERIHIKKACLLTLDGSIDTSKDNTHSESFLKFVGLFAQLEKELITERTKVGQTKAKAKGKHLGRPLSMTAHDTKLILAELEKGVSVSELSRRYNVSRPTIDRIEGKEIMDNGQQIAAQNLAKFKVWIATQTNNDYMQIIVRGRLSRKYVAEAVGCGTRALTQNVKIARILEDLENSLRERGVLPPLTKKA